MAEGKVLSPRVEVRFPGGKAVDASYRGYTISTDQPVKYGGQGQAPSPFDLFLVSIATCAGFYTLEFCQRRGLSTDELGLWLEIERDPERKLVSRVRIHLTLPPQFPEKYHSAISRAIDQCSVKRHLAEPPVIELELTKVDCAA